MAQIPPIDDAYINEIIKSNGPYNPTLLKTQGIKMRELVKWLRDRMEQGDAEAVHKTGDESISGTKTFTLIKAEGLSVNNLSNPSFDTVISPVTGVQTKLLNITEGTFSLQLSASVLAASRSQLLQDKDGVVALTSDLSLLEEQLNTQLDLKIDIDQRGAPGGVSTLDSGGKILASQLPDSISGALTYQGTWDATTNSPMLADPPASFTKGYYYVTNVAGAQFGLTFAVGDWVVSNGTAWEKVDNSDAVTTVFGRLGNILANEADYNGFYPLLTERYVNPSWITSLPYSKITNTPTTLSGFGITNAYTKTESDGLYPLKAGTGATGTWPIAISGNAATATTTTFWNTYTLQTAPITSMDFAFARNSSNIMAPIGSAGFKTWLGIPSAGETLQSVTDRSRNINTYILRTPVNIGSSGNLAYDPIIQYGNTISGNTAFAGIYGTNRINSNYGTGLAFYTVSGKDTNVNALEISPEGNVGLGRTAPSAKLDVNGTGNFSGSVQLGSLSSVQGTTTNSVLLLNTTTSNPGNRNWSIANGKSALGDLAISQSNVAGGNAYSAADSTIRLYFSQAGNVGVGTTTPLTKLDVNGAIRLHFAGAGSQLYSLNAVGSIYQSYHNNAGTRLGYIGFGSSVNNNLYFLNDNGENIYTGTKHTFNSEINGKTASFSGNVTAGQASVITGSAGTIRSLGIRTGATNRWIMYADAGAESGSNTGSNFNIARYSDAGAFLSNSLIINRQTGATTFGGSVSVANAPINPTDVVRKTELDIKAPLASPALTGTPTAPTATAGTNTTQVATTAFVQNSITSSSGGTKTLADFYHSATNLGSTQTLLYTYTVPQNTLKNNGDKITVLFSGTLEDSPSSSFTVSLMTLDFILNAVVGEFVSKATIIRASDTEIRITLVTTMRNSTTQSYSHVVSIASLSANQFFIRLYGTGTASNEITGKMGTIEYKPAAV